MIKGSRKPYKRPELIKGKMLFLRVTENENLVMEREKDRDKDVESMSDFLRKRLGLDWSKKN